MKKIGWLLLLIVVVSCKSKEKMLTNAEIKAKADSILAIKRAELSKQALEDLDRRKSIEVKVITDSIVAAKTKTAP
ncbi:MAG: hypothetical protein JST82_15365 [Bacteroidetes bacterium]|nr:hypothetical protein [Bacteroidota bacterium]